MALSALLAQLVEHLHGKEGVSGSSPEEGFKRCRGFWFPPPLLAAPSVPNPRPNAYFFLGAR
jgi:hypothetical protein